MSEEQTMVQKCFAEIGKRFDGIEQTLRREKEVAYKYMRSTVVMMPENGVKFKFSEDLSEIIEVKRLYYNSETGQMDLYEIYTSHPFFIENSETLIYLNTNNAIARKPKDETYKRILSINKSTFEVNLIGNSRNIPPGEFFDSNNWITKEEYERNTTYS